jgi:YesN/AraC family two-component response regulator
MRVHAAKDLIENSALSLTQVCNKVGYESLTYFGRVFKEFTNITPSQYRKQIHSRRKSSDAE